MELKEAISYIYAELAIIENGLAWQKRMMLQGYDYSDLTTKEERRVLAYSLVLSAAEESEQAYRRGYEQGYKTRELVEAQGRRIG